MSETIVVPDNGSNMNNAWPLMAMNNGGFGGLGNGLGAGVVGFILGALINNNGNGAQTQDMAITVGRDLWIVVEAAESGFVGTVSYESAKTGDSTNLIALSVAMLLAAAGMVTLVIKKKEF